MMSCYDVILSDRTVCTVRMVTPSGIISTIVGTGACTTTPSATPIMPTTATAVQLAQPYSVRGNADDTYLLISEQFNVAPYSGRLLLYNRWNSNYAFQF